MILSIKYLTPYFQYIPRACLGAVIITAVLQMVDYKIVKKIWKINKIDLIPLFCTFFACFYTLEFGLIIGISISLIFVLYPQVYPVLKQDIREMTIIKVDNGVLYLGIEHITSQIENLVKSPDPPIMIVLDLSGLTHIDYTVVNELTQILEETKKANTELYFTNLRLHIREVLIQANLGQYMSTARCSVDKSEEGMPLL